MTVSTLIARFRAFLASLIRKGETNLSIVATLAPGEPAIPAAPVSGVPADVDAADSAAAAVGAAVPASSLGVAAPVAADPGSLGSLVAAAAAAVPLAASVPAGDQTGSDDDAADQADASEGLENVQALIGGDAVELFATAFKGMMSMAIALGHDFEAAFDLVKDHAKALAREL